MSAMTPDMEKKLTIHNVGEMDFTFRSRTSPTRLTPVRDSAGGMPLTRWKLTARYTNTHRKETMKSDHLMNQIRQKTTWYPNSLIQSHFWRNPDISIKDTIKAITAPMESHKTWTRRRLSTKVSMLGTNYHRAPIVPLTSFVCDNSLPIRRFKSNQKHIWNKNALLYGLWLLLFVREKRNCP